MVSQAGRRSILPFPTHLHVAMACLPLPQARQCRTISFFLVNGDGKTYITNNLSIIMKHSLLLALSTGMLLVPTVSALEAWAPGIYKQGDGKYVGWYDYQKTGIDDTGLCWAMTASNVIAWWQAHNQSSIPSSVPQGDEIPDYFRLVFDDGGGKAGYAYNWWVTGNLYDDGPPPGWAYFDKNVANDNPGIVEGGFLKNVYDTTAYPIDIIPWSEVASGTYDPYEYSKTIVTALQNGYALTISTEMGSDVPTGHAYTLWGVTYDITANGYELTSLWLTNSDDINGDLGLYQVEAKCMYADKNGGTGSVIFYEPNADIARTMMEVSGLRTAPLSVPEPASATLSLLALAAMACRRRR
jgi:hypothetical protein